MSADMELQKAKEDLVNHHQTYREDFSDWEHLCYAVIHDIYERRIARLEAQSTG